MLIQNPNLLDTQIVPIWMTYTLDNAYPAGGYPIPLPVTFDRQIVFMFPFNVKGGPYTAQWTPDVLHILNAQGTEVPPNTDLSGVTVDALVVGR